MANEVYVKGLKIEFDGDFENPIPVRIKGLKIESEGGFGPPGGIAVKGLKIEFDGEFGAPGKVVVKGLKVEYGAPAPFEKRGFWSDFKIRLRNDFSWQMRRHCLLFKEEEKWDTDAGWNAGTHAGTSASGGKLVAGAAGGQWTSPVVENDFSGQVPVFRDVFWKEAVGDIPQIWVRGSNISAAQVLLGEYDQIPEHDTNRNVLTWFEWKWIQFKFSMPANAEISEFRFHHQWDVTDFVLTYGRLSFSRGIADRVMRAGDLRLLFENRDGDFDYLIADPSYFNQNCEVWAGMEYGEDIYLFPFYVGFNDDWRFHLDELTVEVDTRNAFGRLREAKLALQTTSTPYRDQVLYYGAQHYVKPRQDQTDKTKYYLDSKYNLTSIDAVYVGRVLQGAGFSTNTAAPGTIDFTAQPSGTVEVDFVGSAITNGINIVKDLLTTEAGFDADFDLDLSSFTDAAAGVSGITLGDVMVKRENALRAIEEVLRNINGVLSLDYLTQTRFTVHVFFPEYAPDYEKVALIDNPDTEARVPSATLHHSRSEWFNRVDAKFKTDLESYTWSDAQAIVDYGESVNEDEKLPYLQTSQAAREILDHFYYLLRKPLAFYELGDGQPLFLTFNLREYLDFYDAGGFVDTLEIIGLTKNFDDFSVPSLVCTVAYSSLINWAFAVRTVGEPRVWYAIDTDSPSDPNWSKRSYAF